MRNHNKFFVLFVGLLTIAAMLGAKDKKVKTPPPSPQDEIQVVGHIPLSNGPVKRFMSTRHYSSYYLYVEYGTGKDVTLVDVTKAAKPVTLANVSYPADGGASLFTVAGTAALVTEQPKNTTPAADVGTVRIMDFSDPVHPKVAREFAGVTALSRDDPRGLIFLANSEGIWILYQSYAEDPAVEKEYTKHILYGE